MRHLLLKLLLVSPVLVLAALVLAADAPAETPTTAQIAGALVLAWGFIAPLTVYKWVKLSDAAMKAFTMIVSVVIALLALALGGGLHLDLTSGIAALGTFSIVYGESMLVWNLLEGHPKTTGLVN